MLSNYEFWFLTGSQDLYGEETLKQVDADSAKMVQELGTKLPCRLVWKPVLKSAQDIRTCLETANSDPNCAGVITWMHTFSPSKMWIPGFTLLNKPLLHLHTQFNRDIPWDDIDMDFMNLNQSAHGDREHGFIGARLRLRRKVVVGHYKAGDVQERISIWMRAASAWADGKALKVMRFGDNMREVAVTEGDKIQAQINFGWSVNGYGLGSLAARVETVSPGEIDRLLHEYSDLYEIPDSVKQGKNLESLKVQARIELALKQLLDENRAKAFTTTFEDLHGLSQLPGLAVQRLMAQGYGFGAEGDWKTAAMLRGLKVMADGLPGGTSFMEDYTYHMESGKESVLGAHMLEVCPSIAKGKPRVEVHPLSIGGKDDPARLVFDSGAGKALNASLVDIGGRFRLILNTVEALEIPQAMPKLPVARVLWRCQPSLREAAEAWILAGGAHHTVYTTSLNLEYMEDWAEMAGTECLIIDESLKLRDFKNQIRWNDCAYSQR